MDPLVATTGKMLPVDTFKLCLLLSPGTGLVVLMVFSVRCHLFKTNKSSRSWISNSLKLESQVYVFKSFTNRH